ncbi:hypothetical protein S7711_07734 [Stachybotrys chartarum IBT 7711]|uniref:F-box domain-containing protein n=1 Tax=Stachybotrys chartarum (strain CBS 109288 / IBT 7711) TaxID=1280523 RepID=A0A084AKV0_STACB|nr:hypothetical protein S7711_07734 [Stachybotrys chartarum IBT 7711]KFA46714.1 hypothetical protein S40293_07777 [Stachybotrys chartarum IBT 40293]KFA78108.1 hypothetical protein S40288_05682 [Stachybotrys chartarum IBT 40288]
MPVEVFNIILSYLPHGQIRTLRLVCKEFEFKVSGQYFRNVVVPFRPELYNTLVRNENGVLRNPTSQLFANGMRIFESFGHHILRFALSLELEEEALAVPPIKGLQQAIPAFWGIYRWPHQNYHRYTNLEALEETADETLGMKEALKCLAKVNNLGLCCDAGLGFLLGPEGQRRKKPFRQPVFTSHNWRQEHREPAGGPTITVADFNEAARTRRLMQCNTSSKLRRLLMDNMLAEAGYQGEQVPKAARLLMDTEGVTLPNITFGERAAHICALVDNVFRSDTIRDDFGDIASLDWQLQALIPSSLTMAQKELLLELEWAHRAMIQSFAISVVDNALQGCFDNVTTLTIAKIPSCHVHILHRECLWASLPNLRNVSLGVLADWRRIVKVAPGIIDDLPVSPVESVPKVFALLSEYIGAQPNIESLHFEWICGGEFAPSTYQRNQYVLPAPFLADPAAMAESEIMDRVSDAILELPHVKHLSLKNCWFSPHIMIQTIRQMALSSLEKLELESVSITGPPTELHQPSVYPNGNHQPTVTPQPGIGTLLSLIHPPPPAQPSNAYMTSSEPALVAWSDGYDVAAMHPAPGLMSWAGIIDHFSPGIKINDYVVNKDTSIQARQEHYMEASIYIPDISALCVDEDRYALRCLSFKSCGYVIVDIPRIDNWAVMPPGEEFLVQHVNFNHHSLSMMSCKDKLCGRIYSSLTALDRILLDRIFRMRFTWENVYDEDVVLAAKDDGFEVPGLGRFSGTLTQEKSLSVDHNATKEPQNEPDDEMTENDTDIASSAAA